VLTFPPLGKSGERIRLHVADQFPRCGVRKFQRKFPLRSAAIFLAKAALFTPCSSLGVIRVIPPFLEVFPFPSFLAFDSDSADTSFGPFPSLL